MENVVKSFAFVFAVLINLAIRFGMIAIATAVVILTAKACLSTADAAFSPPPRCGSVKVIIVDGGKESTVDSIEPDSKDHRILTRSCQDKYGKGFCPTSLTIPTDTDDMTVICENPEEPNVSN